MDGGPLVLSWEDAQHAMTGTGGAAYSVVIHEFVHKIDLLDGEADGIPPLADMHEAAGQNQWRRVLRCTRTIVSPAELDLIEAALPDDT